MMLTQMKNMHIFKLNDIGLKELLTIVKMNWQCLITKSENGLLGIIINH